MPAFPGVTLHSAPGSGTVVPMIRTHVDDAGGLGPVVAGEDDEGVFRKSEFLEQRKHSSHLPVGPGLQDLVDELNRFVIDVGGRIYLTKDGYTRREHFEAMEAERLPAFHAARDRWDPERRLRSAMSVRLFGDPVGPATTTGAGR